MPITQKQLADLAGVSIVTIFNALHQPHKVNEKTRRKIYSLMDQYDYSPDGVARSMVRQKTNIVGIIIPTFEVRYYAQLASVLERRLNEQGYRALISQHLDDPQKEAQEIKMLREYRVDGFIIRNCGLDSDRDQIQKLANANIPFVLVDSSTDGFEDHFIADDDFNGAAHLVDHLLKEGRKRIAYIGFHRSGDFRKGNRYKGYCKALIDHGIAIDQRYSEACLSEYDDGQLALQKIMARTADAPIDAVFAVNDHTALNIIRQLCEWGYTPQKEILVAGYGGYMDNTFLPFRLPTIRQDVEGIGEKAVTQLLSRIDASCKTREATWVKGELLT